ncbi:MAG: hypothetical protein ACOZF0_22440 [Thermodesulfobacteriota bacterium]
MSVRQRLVVVFLDVLVLIELTACLFWASRDQETLTTVFLCAYLPMAIGTLIAGKYWIRKVQSRELQQIAPTPPCET